MPAPRIRIEYDVMDQIAKKFFTQADLANKSLKSLRTQMGSLQDGDWIGKGAKKFFSEMDSGVLPSVQRLSKAFEEGGQVTRKIGQVMHQADEDAARLIALHDSGIQANGTRMPAPIAGLKASQVAAASATKAIQARNKAVDRMLSKLDPKVRAIIKNSPTLTRQIQKLEGKVKIKLGPASQKNSYYNHKTKEIVLAPGRSTNAMVSSIAHEVGHANYGKVPYHKPTAGMTKSEYIRKNVQEYMRNEGSAQLNAAIVRDEVKKAGGPTLGMPGSQDAKYVKVYNDYKKGTITRQQAINKNGKLMGNETTGGVPYKDYYGSVYGKHWNKTVGRGKTRK